MDFSIGSAGMGHALGSAVVDNVDTARAIGLADDWLVERTGIEQRRVCAEHEDVVSLSATAISLACADASLDVRDLGHETLLIHVQNGLTHFTPPAVVVLAGRLGMNRVRLLGLDGVCAEPVSALQIGAQMLRAGVCSRVILSAAANFLRWIDPTDADTAGLFGAGAGAWIITGDPADGQAVRIRGLHWASHPEHWDLGGTVIRERRLTDRGLAVEADFYSMHGQSLYRTALRVLPQVLQTTLDQAGWKREDLDLVVAHQPNVRMLHLACKHLDLDVDKVPTPGRTMGNLGPASLLVNLSLARDDGKITSNTRALLFAFGLGFTAGAAALAFGEK